MFETYLKKKARKQNKTKQKKNPTKNKTKQTNKKKKPFSTKNICILTTFFEKGYMNFKVNCPRHSK